MTTPFDRSRDYTTNSDRDREETNVFTPFSADLIVRLPQPRISVLTKLSRSSGTEFREGGYYLRTEGPPFPDARETVPFGPIRFAAASRALTLRCYLPDKIAIEQSARIVVLRPFAPRSIVGKELCAWSPEACSLDMDFWVSQRLPTTEESRMPLPTDERIVALSDEILQKFEGLFGAHPGFRPAHAKGIMLYGTFTPTPEAATLSRAPHFNRPSTPATMRFSNSTGIPVIPDNDPNADPRGCAIRFHLAERVHTDIVAHSTNAFPARTGQDFLELLTAISLTDLTHIPGSPLEEYLGTHPAALAFVQLPNRRHRASRANRITVLTRCVSSTRAASLVTDVIASSLWRVRIIWILRQSPLNHPTISSKK